jgi:hypothetical protein
MSVKSFSTGEVLTASDTNTFLANSGLVYIKEQVIGSGVNSTTGVTVTNAFSATYDNYKITISGGGISTAQTVLKFVLGTALGNTYYGCYNYGNLATSVGGVAGMNNDSSFFYAGGADINILNFNMELQNPFLAKYTNMQALTVGYANNRGMSMGEHETATSYSSFTIFPGSGTITGGTITVYGYRKA